MEAKGSGKVLDEAVEVELQRLNEAANRLLLVGMKALRGWRLSCLVLPWSCSLSIAATTHYHAEEPCSVLQCGSRLYKSLQVSCNSS